MTLSEASARHSHKRASNHTLEKLHVRCFETIALCSLPGHWHWMGRLDMNTGRWEMNKGFDTPNWSAAQAFLEHCKKLGKLPQVGEDRGEAGKGENLTLFLSTNSMNCRDA